MKMYLGIIHEYLFTVQEEAELKSSTSDEEQCNDEEARSDSRQMQSE